MRREDIPLLREALPYLRDFTGKTFVVKFGGELVEHQNLALLAEEIAFLAQLGLRLVVVHGGGPQADALARRLGQEPVRVAGRRITDRDTLEVAKMVFRGKVNTELQATLARQGVRAVGLSGLDGGLLKLRKRPLVRGRDPDSGVDVEVDFGFVGDVLGVDTALITRLLDGGYVPVVCSLGSSPQGEILNVNADTVAAEIAIALKADKLLILSSVPGVLRDVKDVKTRISWLTPLEARRLMDEGVVGGGMRPKLRAALTAWERGVSRVHVLSGVAPDALLLELFSHEGCGTVITEDIPAPASDTGAPKPDAGGRR